MSFGLLKNMIRMLKAAINIPTVHIDKRIDVCGSRDAIFAVELFSFELFIFDCFFDNNF